MGEQFERLNVDGDLVAATIARELDADTLIILSNVPGLLRDVDDPASVVPRIRLARDRRATSRWPQGRMKKKMLAAQQAQIPCVILADARVDQPLDAALNGAGTHIVREVSYAGRRELT